MRRNVLVHLAWFHREDGAWIGEWAGYLPSPDLPVGLIGETRMMALNAWLQWCACRISPDGTAFETRDDAWDRDRWNACESGGAVCLDVTRFAWPVGDHFWHRWDDRVLALDWPESSGQQFIQVNDDMRIEGHRHSNRPARNIPGRYLLRVTGTPLAPFWGELWGRFERRGDGVILVPDSGVEPSGRPLVLPQTRVALQATTVEFNAFIQPAMALAGR